MTFRDKIYDKAKNLTKVIALPESKELRILKSIDNLLASTKLRFLVYGEKDFFKRNLKNYDDTRIIVCDMKDKNLCEELANLLYDLRKNKGMTLNNAYKEILNPMMFSTLLLKAKKIDGVVCGTITHTADVLRPVFQIIKTKPGINVASSSLIFDMPKDHKYGKRGPILFADCSVIPNPTSENLKDIALASCDTYKKLVGKKPIVAFLSYSTKSGDDQNEESIVKVKEAVRLTKESEPNLIVDGEMQVDSALDIEVANIKCKGNPVGGKANVFIFPDLNSANIGYKLVSRFSGIPALGVILQGVNSPVNDLSRGANVDEICSMIMITALS